MPESSSSSVPKHRRRKFNGLSKLVKTHKCPIPECQKFVHLAKLAKMKKNMDLREHDRARFAREQLLNVKEEQRMASLAKTDCEERIRLLMEELQEKQKEQESLDEDMMSSAKKAKYLEEQIKRRDTALKKKTPKSDRGKRSCSSTTIMFFTLLTAR